VLFVLHLADDAGRGIQRIYLIAGLRPLAAGQRLAFGGAGIGLENLHIADNPDLDRFQIRIPIWPDYQHFLALVDAIV